MVSFNVSSTCQVTRSADLLRRNCRGSRCMITRFFAFLISEHVCWKCLHKHGAIFWENGRNHAHCSSFPWQGSDQHVSASSLVTVTQAQLGLSRKVLDTERVGSKTSFGALSTSWSFAALWVRSACKDEYWLLVVQSCCRRVACSYGLD